MRCPRLAVALSVAVTIDAARAAALCQIVETAEIVPVRTVLTDEGVFGVDAMESVPGGVWVVRDDEMLVEGALDCGPMRWRRAPSADAPEAELDADVDVVRAGPRFTHFRVPDDAAPGDLFSPFRDCGDGRSFSFARSVTSTDPVDRPDPVVRDATATVLRSQGGSDGCDDTDGPHFAFVIGRSQTLLDVAIDTAADELVVDAWLLDRDAALPAEGDARFDEARLVAVDDGVVRLALEEPGAYDLHLRFLDPATGRVSDDHILEVDTPASEFQGCTCAGSASPADASLGAVFVAGLVACLQRGRRARATRRR